MGAGLGLLWRAEVAWNGWSGLQWMSATHFAVPAGVLVFLGWLARAPVVRATGRRWGLLGFAAPFAAISMVLLDVGLRLMFGRFGDLLLGSGLTFANLAAMPTFGFGWGKLLGHPLPWWSLPVSVTGVLAAFPLAVGALMVVDPAHADAIHAVKTGMIIPFVVVPLGLPWELAPSESAGQDGPVDG
jgi:hypothetical protein